MALLSVFNEQVMHTDLKGDEDFIASNIAHSVSEFGYGMFGKNYKVMHTLTENRTIYVYPENAVGACWIIILNFEANFKNYDIINFNLYLDKPNTIYEHELP